MVWVSFSWNTIPYYLETNLKIGLPHPSSISHLLSLQVPTGKVFLQHKIRLQCSFFFNKHIRPPKIGFHHLLTLQAANHTWQTDLALLGFKGGEVIIVDHLYKRQDYCLSIVGSTIAILYVSSIGNTIDVDCQQGMTGSVSWVQVGFDWNSGLWVGFGYCMLELSLPFCSFRF